MSLQQQCVLDAAVATASFSTNITRAEVNDDKVIEFTLNDSMISEVENKGFYWLIGYKMVSIIDVLLAF